MWVSQKIWTFDLTMVNYGFKPSKDKAQNLLILLV